MSAFASKNYTIYVVFFILCFGCYYNSINNGFGLDDAIIFQYIPEKGSDFSSIFDVFGSRYAKNDYRPISLFTFAAEQYFFGEINTTISHLLNIFLFFLLSCLIYSTLIKLPVPNIKIIIFFTVVLFISHPVHAGVVNNLKSRDNLFSMLFVFLSLNSYLNYEIDKRKTELLKVFLFFILGLISKLDAINLIFILPSISLFYFERKWKRSILLFVLIFAIYQFIFQKLLNYYLPAEELTNAQTVMYTENPLPYINSIYSTAGLSIITLWKYVTFMLIPTGYYFYFGFNQIPVLPIYNPVVLLKLLGLLFIISGALYAYKKDKLLSLSILLFFLNLAYCANLFLPVQGILADRYAFMASVWFCLGLSTLFYKLSAFEKISGLFNKNISASKVYIIFVLFVSILYVSFLIPRNNVWKDTITLIESDMPHLKESFDANRIAAGTYLNKAIESQNNLTRQNYFFRALQYSKQGNAIYSKDIYMNESEGMAYYGIGKIESAEKQFKKTIQLFDTSAVSWDILGDINFRRGNYDSAALCYFNLIRVEPFNEAAYYKYPNALNKGRREDSALAFSMELIIKYPDRHIGYENAAYTFLNHGDTLKGLDFIETAFEKGLNNKNAFQYFSDIRKRYPNQKKKEN